MIDILRKKLPLETYKNKHQGVLRRYYFSIEEKSKEELEIDIPIESMSTETQKSFNQKMNHFFDKAPNMSYSLRDMLLVLRYKGTITEDYQADEIIYEIHDTLMILKELDIKGSCINCGATVEAHDTHGLCEDCEVRRAQAIGQGRLKPFSLIGFALFTLVLFYLLCLVTRRVGIFMPLFPALIALPGLMIYRKTGGNFKRKQRIYLAGIFILIALGSHILTTAVSFRDHLNISLGEMLRSLPYLYVSSSYAKELLLELLLYVVFSSLGFFISYLAIRRTERVN